MKKIFVLFVILLMGLTGYSQGDDYGNYFNVSNMVPPPKGNGSTNDRNVFLKALTTYKSIFIPRTAKGYLITEKLNIPAGCKLVFDVGAKFVGTGTIVGNGTQIEGNGQIFDTLLTMAGTWLVPLANSAWFGNHAVKYAAFVALLSDANITSMNLKATNINIAGTIASPTFTGTTIMPAIKITSADTSVAVVGQIIYNPADSSLYLCRSTLATKKWYKLD